MTIILNTFIIQWGWKNPGTATWQPVQLPVAYSNTSYAVAAVCASNNIALWVDSFTTTQFKQYQNVVFCWISVGY